MKFLWGNFECLVVQVGLLCKQVGPLVDASNLVTVYLSATLRRVVIVQCHGMRTAGHEMLVRNTENLAKELISHFVTIQIKLDKGK